MLLLSLLLVIADYRIIQQLDFANFFNGILFLPFSVFRCGTCNIIEGRNESSQL